MFEELDDTVVSVTGYKSNFNSLTKEMFDNKPEEYELSLILIKYKKLLDGYFIKRILKPNKKGTGIYFSRCEDKESIEVYCKEIKSDIKSYESKYLKKIINIDLDSEVVKLSDHGESKDEE